MGMEPAVNTVVEVFMDRRSEYLPRLMRIAQVMAECAGVGVSPGTQSALIDACNGPDSHASHHTTVRFTLQLDEVVADCGALSLNP